MRELRKINSDASISKKWLSFDESWLDKLNRLTVVILFALFVFWPLMSITHEKFTNSNELFILHWILPGSILIGLYGIFRALAEKRLIQITTSQDKETIRKTILEYAEKQELEVYRNSKDCIILNSPHYVDINTSHKKTRIFFFKDGLLLFTVIRDNFKLNFPVFSTHFFVKYDLTRMLKKANIR